MNHKHIVKRIYEKYKPEAISIFGYEERRITDFRIIQKGFEKNDIDDFKYQPTSGMSEFVAFGDWSKAGESSDLKDFEFKIK